MLENYDDKTKFGFWRILKHFKCAEDVATHLGRNACTIRKWQSKNGVIPPDVMRLIDLDLVGHFARKRRELEEGR